MPGSDWVPTREQDLVDLAEKWKTGETETETVTETIKKQVKID